MGNTKNCVTFNLKQRKAEKNKKPRKEKTHQNGGFFSFPRSSINENRIQQPILGTSEQDMERLQTQVREQMSQ